MDEGRFSKNELREIEALEVRGGAGANAMAQGECTNSTAGCGAGVDQPHCTNSAAGCGSPIVITQNC